MAASSKPLPHVRHRAFAEVKVGFEGLDGRAERWGDPRPVQNADWRSFILIQPATKASGLPAMAIVSSPTAMPSIPMVIPRGEAGSSVFKDKLAA